MELWITCKCGNRTNYGPMCVNCSKEEEAESPYTLEDLEEYLTCEDYLEIKKAGGS